MENQSKKNETELKVGIEYELKQTVKYEHTAEAYGSGALEVFATPHMIALMEGSAMLAVKDLLLPTQTTVGTKVNIEHIAATPVGMEVRALSKLIEVDGRRLVYEIEAWDEKERIGFGTHERFVIYSDKFLEKVKNKK